MSYYSGLRKKSEIRGHKASLLVLCFQFRLLSPLIKALWGNVIEDVGKSEWIKKSVFILRIGNPCPQIKTLSAGLYQQKGDKTSPDLHF